jgi:hypothetical protein
MASRLAAASKSVYASLCQTTTWATAVMELPADMDLGLAWFLSFRQESLEDGVAVYQY